MTQTLTLAVCICNGVTLSDFVPPMEILASANMVGTSWVPAELTKDIKYRFAIDYVAPTKEPVHSLAPTQITINPTRTYREVLNEGTQYDIIWVPAGPVPLDLTSRPLVSEIPEEQIDFIRKQGIKAKYIISVCAGSLQLAAAGLLDGKRATTNKSLFKAIVSQTSGKIEWVAKARWVVDGNTWTSSGVSAGSDMALAFLEHLTSKDFAQVVRGTVEVAGISNSEDDPFASIFGLI